MEFTDVWGLSLQSVRAPVKSEAGSATRLVEFDAAYLKLGPALRRIATFRGGLCPADANDFVNEVFIKVWLKLGEFRGESKLETWIFKFAYNHARNERKRLRLKLDRGVDCDSVPCLATNTPEERALRGEAEAQWMLVLEQFPEDERKLAIAWWLTDDNVSEAARLCGMSIDKAQKLWASFHDESARVFKRLQRTGWKQP